MMRFSTWDIDQHYGGKPEDYWYRARLVLAELFSAIQHGGLEMLQPGLGEWPDSDMVRTKMAQIDREWLKEQQTGRGSGYDRPPEFATMPYPQQVALYQRLEALR